MSWCRQYVEYVLRQRCYCGTTPCRCDKTATALHSRTQIHLHRWVTAVCTLADLREESCVITPFKVACNSLGRVARVLGKLWSESILNILCLHINYLLIPPLQPYKSARMCLYSTWAGSFLTGCRGDDDNNTAAFIWPSAAHKAEVGLDMTLLLLWSFIWLTDSLFYL